MWFAYLNVEINENILEDFINIADKGLNEFYNYKIQINDTEITITEDLMGSEDEDGDLDFEWYLCRAANLFGFLIVEDDNVVLDLEDTDQVTLKVDTFNQTKTKAEWDPSTRAD